MTETRGKRSHANNEIAEATRLDQAGIYEYFTPALFLHCRHFYNTSCIMLFTTSLGLGMSSA